MTKIAIAKEAVSAVVGLGTVKIVSSIIKNNVDLKTTTDKVTVMTSSFVLGSMAADATKQYTDAKIDSAVAWYNEKFKKNS